MKEQEIRPEALLRRYLELSARDAAICFNGGERREIACVACGGNRASHQFEKNGFAYARCEDCATLFQSPRPEIGAFEGFYRRSESSRYWAEVFFPAVAEVRREKLVRPKVERLAGLCAEKALAVRRLIDVGAGFGIFLDEWRRRFPQTESIAIEPSSLLAQECRRKGFRVIEEIVENAAGCDDWADLVACFEVLEHVYDPVAFVRVLAALARPGGWVFVSTLGIDGFDLQVLWEKSGQIFPPHHINFLSVRGFERLFERAGLQDVVVVTPGQLDVDIVRNAAKKDPALLQGQRFLQNLIADDRSAAAFQDFLVERRMSSHVWILGRKPDKKFGIHHTDPSWRAACGITDPPFHE